MRITDDLKAARLSVVRAAELANMHPSHFRRLCRKGVFPEPKRTSKGRPYFDYGLLTAVARVLKSGVGTNGEEIIFYRRKPRSRAPKQRSGSGKPSVPSDPYLVELAQCLRQLGYSARELTPAKLDSILNDEFGGERPELNDAVIVVNRRLSASTDGRD